MHLWKTYCESSRYDDKFVFSYSWPTSRGDVGQLFCTISIRKKL